MRFLTCYEVQDLKLIREDLFPYLFPPKGQRFSHFAEKSNQLVLMVKGFFTVTVLPKNFHFLLEFLLVIDHASDSKSSM